MSPKLAIPTDSVGLEELLNDATKMKSIWKEGQFGELTKAYATSMAANHTDELRSDLLMVSLESSVMRPRATIIPMGTQRVSIPSVDSTTDASSVFGGVV